MAEIISSARADLAAMLKALEEPGSDSAQAAEEGFP